MPEYDIEIENAAWERLKRLLFCPNDGERLQKSTNPRLSGCYECRTCGFVQGRGVMVVGAEGEPN